jgi:hypothetical protein
MCHQLHPTRPYPEDILAAAAEPAAEAAATDAQPQRSIGATDAPLAADVETADATDKLDVPDTRSPRGQSAAWF